MPLNTAPNLAHPDEFYEALIAMHHDLDDAESQAVNARLILLLANHIGEPDTLRHALQLARGSAPAQAPVAPERAAITPVAPVHAEA